jgi:hypothetical protein
MFVNYVCYIEKYYMPLTSMHAAAGGAARVLPRRLPYREDVSNTCMLHINLL